MAAARVDLPTPPLPEPTAITFLTPGMSPFSVIPLPRTSAVMVIWKVQSAPSRLVKAVADVALDLGLERAGGGGQVDGQRHRAVADPDVLDHPQVDQVAVEVGILDPFQGIEHVRLGEGRVVLPNISRYPSIDTERDSPGVILGEVFHLRIPLQEFAHPNGEVLPEDHGGTEARGLVFEQLD